MYLIIIMMYLDGFNICDPQSFRENLVRLSLYCSPTCSTYQQWLTFPAPSSPLQSGTQHILVFRDFIIGAEPGPFCLAPPLELVPDQAPARLRLLV